MPPGQAHQLNGQMLWFLCRFHIQLQKSLPFLQVQLNVFEMFYSIFQGFLATGF